MRRGDGCPSRSDSATARIGPIGGDAGRSDASCKTGQGRRQSCRFRGIGKTETTHQRFDIAKRQRGPTVTHHDRKTGFPRQRAPLTGRILQ